MNEFLHINFSCKICIWLHWAQEGFSGLAVQWLKGEDSCKPPAPFLALPEHLA